MNVVHDTLADYRRAFGQSWSLPERRRIEMHSAKRHHVPPGSDGSTPLHAFAGLNFAWQLLDEHAARALPDLGEGLSSWQRYLALPRGSLTEKLAAQVYRLLRVAHIAQLHPQGFCKRIGDALRLGCTSNRYPVELEITPEGLNLLEAFVFEFLASFVEPYGQGYIELMLMQYFQDIVSEIRAFEDEDRALFQFRQTLHFNRHLRLLCTNPIYALRDDHYCFTVPEAWQDRPIDFCFLACDALHIVPVEALRDYRLPRTDLAAWRLRGAPVPQSALVAL